MTISRKKITIFIINSYAAHEMKKSFLSSSLSETLRTIDNAVSRAETAGISPHSSTGYQLNPSLEVIPLEWRVADLYSRCKGDPGAVASGAVPGEEFAVVWKPGADAEVQVKSASPDLLLALKLVAEDLTPLEAREHHGIDLRHLDAALDKAVEEGILLRPRSGIRREFPAEAVASEVPGELAEAHSFAIQWHITQACDLHCRHCYDRSSRRAVSLAEGERILTELRAFCDAHFVSGHVVFTGGNPFLHPNFPELYSLALELGFTTAILGNPVPEGKLDELLSIGRPEFYQISLEGLEEHTDYIRGEGHFRRSIEFLHLLADREVTSSVMLTLTKHNREQVIPLAQLLEGKAGGFTFNRLVPIGEGAALQTVPPEEFHRLAEEFVTFESNSSCAYLKDNLLNITLERQGRPPFDGCTGYGCGAAFNFIAVLSDGTAHACRKFPSPLGNVLQQGLDQIYHSEQAARYRRGCKGCDGCRLRPRCGGCLAVAYGSRRDPFLERDPYCFIDGEQ